MYDDKEDPYQLNNLVENEEALETAAVLEEELYNWLVKLDDPFETTEQGTQMYYRGADKGVMQYYQNDTIKREIESRSQKRALEAKG